MSDEKTKRKQNGCWNDREPSKTTLVVSQAEGVGCRIEHADLKNASSGSNATTRPALYSTRKT
jgi:hypothetical protein